MQSATRRWALVSILSIGPPPCRGRAPRRASEPLPPPKVRAVARPCQSRPGASGRLLELLQDPRVLERRDVLGNLLAPGDRAQQPPHDLAGAGLRQVVAEADVPRLRDRPDLLRDPVAQLSGELLRLLAARPRAPGHAERHDRLAGDLIGTA